jgi:WD40 repeat protein
MVIIQDVHSGQRKLVLADDRGGGISGEGIFGAAFSPDNRLVATFGEDPNWPQPHGDPESGAPPTLGSFVHQITVRIWSLRTGKLLRTLRGPGNEYAEHLLFTPDGKRLIFFGGGIATTLRTSDYSVVGQIEHIGGGRNSTTADGRLIAWLSSEEKRILVWRLQN